MMLLTPSKDLLLEAAESKFVACLDQDTFVTFSADGLFCNSHQENLRFKGATQ